MLFFCENSEVNEEVDRHDCPGCVYYEDCKKDGYLKEVDEKLRLLSTQAKEGKEEERVEQKLAGNDLDHAYFQNLVSFPKTPERAALSNKAKL